MFKKVYIPTLLILFSLNFIQAQKIIEFDFATKSWGSNLSENELTKGEYFQVKVKNINLNLWKIGLKSKDTTISKELNIPTFESINISSLSSLVSNFQGSVSLVAQDSIVGEYFERQGGSLQNLEGYYLSCDYVLDRLKYDITLVNDSIVSKLSYAISDFDRLVNKVNKVRWSLLAGDNATERISYTSILGEAQRINSSLSDIDSKIYVYKKIYNSLLEGNESESICIEQNEVLKKSTSQFIKVLDGIQKKVEEFEKNTKPDKIDALIKSIFFLTNTKEYTTFPVQYFGEQTKVTLNFEPRSAEYNLNSGSTTMLVPKLSRSGNWSVGPSFFVSSLSSEEFSTIGTQEGETTTYQILEEESDDFELGIASLVRYEIIDNDKLDMHISFGPGVNIGRNIRPRLLFGSGISIGKKNHLSIDIGGIAGYVDRKSNIVDLEQTYSVLPDKTTVTRLKIGYFIGIGYFFNL
jgi:hypothetical protein